MYVMEERGDGYVCKFEKCDFFFSEGKLDEMLDLSENCEKIS